MIRTYKGETYFPWRTFPFYIQKKTEGYTFPHRHNFLELVYVWKGKAVHSINKDKVNVCHGDVLFIGFHDRHGYQKTEDLEIINILFLPGILGKQTLEHDGMRPLLNFALLSPLFEKDLRCLHLSGVADIKARMMIEDMLSEFQERKTGFQEMIRNALSSFLIALGRVYKNEESKVEGLKEKVTLYRRGFEKALRYVDENYTHEITLSEAAGIACFAPNYFSEIFRKVTGKHFVRYLTDLRMGHTALLLKNTQLNVAAISRQCGFSDYRHFERTFKAAFGCTPSDYRKKSTHS